MKLSRKFDIYILINTVFFIFVFVISYNTIKFLSTETASLLNYSAKVEYLTNLKNSITNLEHSIEHYLHAMSGKGKSEDIRRDLSAFESILKSSDKMQLGDEGKRTISYMSDNFSEFSNITEKISQNEELTQSQKIELYEEWREGYLEKLLDETNQLRKVYIQKMNTTLKNSEITQKRAQQLFLIAVIMVSLIIIFSKLI